MTPVEGAFLWASVSKTLPALANESKNGQAEHIILKEHMFSTQLEELILLSTGY